LWPGGDGAKYNTLYLVCIQMRSDNALLQKCEYTVVTMAA